MTKDVNMDSLSEDSDFEYEESEYETLSESESSEENNDEDEERNTMRKISGDITVLPRDSMPGAMVLP